MFKQDDSALSGALNKPRKSGRLCGHTLQAMTAFVRTGRVNTCAEHLDNTEIQLYFLFLEFILPPLIQFNTTVQVNVCKRNIIKLSLIILLLLNICLLFGRCESNATNKILFLIV